MTEYELTRLRAQLAILKEVAEEYGGKTIECIIMNVESRIKWNEEHAES